MGAQERDFECIGSLGPLADAGFDLELVKRSGLHDGRAHYRLALQANKDCGGRNADFRELGQAGATPVRGSIQVGQTWRQGDDAQAGRNLSWNVVVLKGFKLRCRLAKGARPSIISAG